jgi:hypothetical protein
LANWTFKPPNAQFVKIGILAAQGGTSVSGFCNVAISVDFWRESNKPPFDSLQSFLGLHFTSGIIARSAASPDLTKNQPIGP